MNTQPTPRTDAEHNRICELWGSKACDYEKMKNFSCQIERELATVTAQRDMLVEALEIAANRFRYPEFGCNWENVSKEIESALQALTPKP